MTDETQLNIDLAVIVAEATCKPHPDGPWQYDTLDGRYLRLDGERVAYQKYDDTFSGDYYGPDFTRSIDAQEPLRKLVKERRLEEKYMTSLRRFTGISEPQIMIASLGHLGGYYLDWDSIYELAHTPALQRAEAYRKTLS